MTANRTTLEKKRTLPTALSVVCLLLIVNAVLVLLGCFLYAGQDFTRPYYVAGSGVIIAGCILILMDHKWALPLSFVCAALLTIDATVKFIPFKAFMLSVHPLSEAARTLFNIALYWVGFLWYKRWRTASSP